jgi:hypothetical protein
MAASLAEAAQSLGKSLVLVATNLRQTQFGSLNWGKLSHGGALAAVGLLFEHYYHKILIPSSSGYSRLYTWGSHPLIDHLHSTESLRVVHHGARFTRPRKTELVARSEIALQHLHVCWANSDDKNCGDCGKCYRTMTTLMVLDKLQQSRCFAEGYEFSLHKLNELVIGEAEVFHMRQVAEFAIQLGRDEIADAIFRGIKHARYRRHRKRLRGLLNRFRPLFNPPTTTQ